MATGEEPRRAARGCRPALGSDLGVATCLVAVVTAAEHRLLVLFHTENAGELVVEAASVLTGEPRWRAYQNRLLGPWLAEKISAISGESLDTSYALFALFALFSANLLAYFTLRQLSGNARLALLHVALSAGLFAALQDPRWLYVWDLVDAVVFVLFAYGVFTGRSLVYFLPLFLVDILNRETALFIPIWLFLDATVIERSKAGALRPRIRKGWQAVVAVVSFAAGAAFVHWVRGALFRRSGLIGIGEDLDHLELGNHIAIDKNLRDLVLNVIQLRAEIIVDAILVLLGVLLAVSFRGSSATRRIAVLVAAMIAAVLVFGRINETRSWLALIPFALLLGWSARGVIEAQDAATSA